MDYDPREEIIDAFREVIVEGYTEFEKLFRSRYGGATADQSLHAVRQFSRFVTRGEEPYCGHPPDTP